MNPSSASSIRREMILKSKPAVAFVCVHNSCRSQMAEAISRLLAEDVYDAYSAGTETKPQINQNAVRIIKQLYDIDMEQSQFPKLIADIPEVDIVKELNCNGFVLLGCHSVLI